MYEMHQTGGMAIGHLSGHNCEQQRALAGALTWVH